MAAISRSRRSAAGIALIVAGALVLLAVVLPLAGVALPWLNALAYAALAVALVILALGAVNNTLAKISLFVGAVGFAILAIAGLGLALPGILLTIGAARRFAGTEDLLSLARPKGGALLKVAAVLGLLVFAALVAFLVFNVDRDAFISDISTFSGIMQSGGWWAIPIVAAVGAPLAEEFLFRGYLYGTLKRTPLDRTGAAIISSGMWTALHPGYSVYGLAALFCIGIYLVLLRDRTGSLVMPIACHAIYNSIVVLVMVFLPPSVLAQ
mgnify:CR=1 FL=1